MSCFPFVKHLRKFGRIISNMALRIKTNNFTSKNNYYKLPILDSEIENNTGSFYSSFQSKLTPASSEPPSLTSCFVFDNEDETHNTIENSMNSYFRSFSLDENTESSPSTSQSSPSLSYKSSWEESINNLFDPTTTQIENFVQSSRGGFSDCSMFSYSPLSSFDSISYDSSYNDLYCNDFNYRMQHECIRREFEMNGNVVEDVPQKYNFLPMAMSTPFVERKCDQFKYNNSNKENIPMHHQMDEMKENVFNLIQFESVPQKFSIPMNDDKKPTVRAKKRIHQPYIYSNQLQSFNNDLNQQKASNKKFAKKKAQNNNKKKKADDHCVFCKNNGVEEIIYKSHTVKDSKGRVLCPRLRAYQCPICGEDGDNSHTMKYCPKKPIVTMDDLKKMQPGKRF